VKAYPTRWQLVAQSSPAQGVDLRVYRVLPNVSKIMDWVQLSTELAPHNKFGN